MPYHTCSVDDCDRKVRTRIYCEAHHLRWKRTGDPLKARPDFECVMCGETSEATGPRQKACQKCRAEYEIQYNREWRKNNPAYHSEYNARWRRENPEAYRAYANEYRLKNLDAVRARYAEWAARNPDYAKRWIEANRERSRETTRRHRARLRAVPTYEVTERDIKRMLARHDFCCAYCREPLAEGYHIDHVMPVSAGGPNSVGNLAPACATCNVSKSNYFLSEWRYRDRLSRPLKRRKSTFERAA